MSEPTRIRVCIVALTHGQHQNIGLAGLVDLLVAHSNQYNVLIKGKVYGDSPDEWSPFDDATPILRYLKDANFEVTSISRCISTYHERASRDALITQVDLYIIDPLFLALEGDANRLISQLESAIRSGNKAFCVLFPGRLPPDLAHRLSPITEQKLELLKLTYEQEGLGGWMVDTPLRLNAFLGRLRSQLRPKPSQVSLEAIMDLFSNRGIPRPAIDGTPRLVGG